MASATITKQGLHQAIESLPPKSLDELAEFVEYLAHKYQVSPDRKVVVLGGIWKNVDFDVEDDEIRALRQKVSDQLSRELPECWAFRS